MIITGLLDIFRKQPKTVKYAPTLDGWLPMYGQFGTNIYTSDAVQQAVSCIVKEMKKSFAFIEATLSHEGQVCSQCDMIYFCFSEEKSASEFGFYGGHLEQE